MLLYAVGDLDLHKAVDELQGRAIRVGLVADIGQDAVQAILASTFGAVDDDEEDSAADAYWNVPSWREAAQDYHENPRPPLDPQIAERCRHLLSADISLDGVIQRQRLSGRAAASTIEALMLGLRERGEAALAEPDCRRRLAEASTGQIREILERLMQLRPRYPAITDDLLFLLGEQL